MDSKNTSYMFMEGGIERAGEQAERPGRKLLERYRVAWTRVWTMMTSHWAAENRMGARLI